MKIIPINKESGGEKTSVFGQNPCVVFSNAVFQE